MNWHLDLHLLSSHLSPEFVYIFQSSLFELTLILPSLLFSTEIFQFVVCGLSLRGPQQMSIFTHFYDGVPLWCASPLCCSSSPIVLVSIEHQGEWLRLSNCANSHQKKRRLTRGWSLCKAGVAQGYITPMPGIATIAIAENHIKMTVTKFFDSATVSCCAHKLRILNVYLVDNGTERQLYVVEGGDQCAVHGFSSCA